MPRQSEAPPAAKLDWHQLLEEALTVPGSLGQWYNRFYNYSFGNQVLLWSQGLREPCASYKRFQAMGRQVVRGAKAKAIVRPITIKRETEDGDTETFTRFKLVNSVFGVSETTGDELPAPETPDWSADRMLANLDIKRVPFVNLNGNIAGYSYDRNFALNPVCPDPLKTTLHEASHILGGHTTPEMLGKYAVHRGLFEFEAETPAYLALKELDALSEETASVSRAYVQHYVNGERPPESSIRRVFATTDALLRAGRPTTVIGVE